VTPAHPAIVPAGEQCVLCGVRLTTPFLIERGLCGSCSDRPEAKRLPRDPKGHVIARATPSAAPAAPPAVRRAFGPAAKSLIKAMHAYLPATELLRILNDRLVADVGPSAVRFTLEDLQEELRRVAEPTAAANDWTGLRQVLAQARRDGVLAVITMQTVEDFAVCFQLSPAQLLHLKDVIRHAKEQR
jgi:hypothetical protein